MSVKWPDPKESKDMPSTKLTPLAPSSSTRFRRFYVLSILDCEIDFSDVESTHHVNEHLENCRQLGSGELFGSDTISQEEKDSSVPLGEFNTRDLIIELAERIKLANKTPK